MFERYIFFVNILFIYGKCFSFFLFQNKMPTSGPISTFYYLEFSVPQDFTNIAGNTNPGNGYRYAIFAVDDIVTCERALVWFDNTGSNFDNWKAAWGDVFRKITILGRTGVGWAANNFQASYGLTFYPRYTSMVNIEWHAAQMLYV